MTEVCLPVMIFPVSDSRFRAYPDLLDIAHDDKERTVIWAFPPHARFYFAMSPPAGVPKDGVDPTSLALKDPGDVNSCFATNQIDGSGPGEQKGKYFRCKVRGHAYLATAYDVRFHDDRDIQRRLDPTVTNTRTPLLFGVLGGPSPSAQAATAGGIEKPRTPATMQTAPVVRIKLSSSGNADPLEAVVPSSGSDPIRIVWSITESGAVFDRDPTSGPADIIGVPNIGSGALDGCFPVDLEDGGTEQTRGSYYQCMLPPDWSILPTSYEIRFHDAQGRQVTARGTLAKP